MSLIQLLADYDGRTVAHLEEIRGAVEPTAEVFDQILALAAGPDDNAAIGATWLLRRWLEDGASLPRGFTAELAGRLPDITDAWARQHICHCVADLDIEPAEVPAFADFLRSCRASDRPFLRAWATDALVRLADRHDHLTDEAQRAVGDALTDPAASVRARARRLLSD